MTTATQATNNEASDTEAILESAKALRPLIEEHRDDMETQGRMPRVLVDAMLDAGLFHLLVPRSAGGSETDPITYLRVAEEVSAVDGSAGWNLMIGSGSALAGGFVPEKEAKEIFGPRDILAAVLAPTGRADPKDGGYTVKGRWSFASGIHNSTWVFGTCMVFDGDAPRMTDEGTPVMMSVIVPVADCEIHETWDVSGLRGTGSEDFSITDVFVPAERTLRLFFSQPYSDAPLYRLPFTFFPACVATVPLGIARGAIDAFVELATTKVPMRQNRTPLRERPAVQATVAKAEALLGSARAYFYESMEAVWDEVQSEGEATLERRATLRSACCHAAISCAEAVDLVYNAGGGTSIYSKSLLQRAFRDVHATTQHIGVAPDSMEDVGRIMFGLEPSGPMF